MANKEHKQGPEEAPAPAWVQKLLDDYVECPPSFFQGTAVWEADQTPLSSHLLERCRAAASDADRIRRLRHQAQKLGFVAVPFGEYVAVLCRSAQVALEPVLEWAGIDDLSRLGADAPQGIARLGAALGLELRQLVAHVKLALIQQESGLPVGAMGRARGTGDAGDSTLEAYEQMIDIASKSIKKVDTHGLTPVALWADSQALNSKLNCSCPLSIFS